LLGELRPDVEAYFADDQSSVEGLSSNILSALYRAAGFICVMHRRGNIETPENKIVTRASVWIEQEVAIVAFITHVLGRSIPMFFYKHEEVSLEGIRSVLMMNPRVQFTDELQVLEDLRSVLPTARFNPFREYDVEPVITYKCLDQGRGAEHTYQLTVDIENTGTHKVDDFLLRVKFPRAFLLPHTSYVEQDDQCSTPSHACFTVSQRTREPDGLYPTQRMTRPFTLTYRVNSRLFHDREAMGSKIIVELFSGSMTPKKRELNMHDFNIF
jgi:hypothetical protein